MYNVTCARRNNSLQNTLVKIGSRSDISYDMSWQTVKPKNIVQKSLCDLRSRERVVEWDEVGELIEFIHDHHNAFSIS